ncbi:terpene synthase family protein [Algoriphagus halophytocola]|uniref:terpene synthase family protein n=1 Tax=Algoriphagus halophytocola TaxID=2991499 RepID=UPI0022DE95A9|nr:terpene synthase family protein [Algoriphagus sp. TR-M9]WBL43564.1 terpene synthase family protein [Algoriphagus sp. TR-M9]
MKAVFEFPVAMNRHCIALDVEVLRWAWAAGLFESPAELERCRTQKINWFAAYLFPEELPLKLELIMKFFLCLFLLDDLLDIYLDRDMEHYLIHLRSGKASHPVPRLEKLGASLLQFNQEIVQANGVSGLGKQWEQTWQDHLEALQWELRSKRSAVPPVLEAYRRYRPIASGAYLAMGFLRTDNTFLDCFSELLESQLARFICLSNDLASHTKELKIGDFHNEVLILREEIGDIAIGWVQNEIVRLRKSIWMLAEQVGSQSEQCDRWARSLLLQAGGCTAWTAETSRYQVYINGNSATH